MTTYALITGGSKGIGKAIAVELAKQKINVLLVARSEQQLQLAVQEIKENYSVQADYLVADLSLNNSAETVYNWCLQKQYTVHILVNNAGYAVSGAFENSAADANSNMMQLNMLTTVAMCHRFLPMLKQQPKSYIMNIASTTAYQAIPFLGLYSASKAFVLSFSRALSHEVKNTSVSVTAISPGPTDTDFPQRAELKEKAKKAADKFSMPAQKVAAIAVKAMFARKREIVIGFINKVGALLAWLSPKAVTEITAASIYK